MKTQNTIHTHRRQVERGRARTRPARQARGARQEAWDAVLVKWHLVVRAGP